MSEESNKCYYVDADADADTDRLVFVGLKNEMNGKYNRIRFVSAKLIPSLLVELMLMMIDIPFYQTVMEIQSIRIYAQNSSKTYDMWFSNPIYR